MKQIVLPGSIFFLKKKTELASQYKYDATYIEEFTKQNHVHPSFFYVFNAYDSTKNNSKAWGLAHKFNPGVKDSIKNFENPWDKSQPIEEFIKTIKRKIYE